MSSIELLAPAKDLECGVAAINCGADAVYTGAARFGARENAGNSLGDIAELARYAHKFWAKVYVTVNTLLHDEEIPYALDLIQRLHEIGIDGLIIQDVGLLECELPPLPLIASTQMHNHSPERVAFLEKVGFQRAILARELDLEQIREIRRDTHLELEFFVHGALCVCYSGQCYLSYAQGGRSGNRGQCAQPCRKSYSLLDAQGKVLERERHLLSLRDLNLSEHLGELIDAGVSSFKIEGRLKDRAYVSNIVAYYRTQLDRIMAAKGLKRASSGTSRLDFEPNPSKTFNRGYTTYFLHGRDAAIGSPDTPKTVGEPVGPVVSVGGRAIVLDTKLTLHRGDGLSFFDRRRELRGTMVNEVRGRIIEPAKLDGIEKGTLVYRNHDHEFLTRLAKGRPERRIALSLALREAPEGFSLFALDEDGNSAEFAIACGKVAAQKPEQARENIRRQLVKAGETQFACTELALELEEAPFLPISTLNALRRGVLERLSEVRAANRPALPGGVLRNSAPYPEKSLSYLGNVLNGRAEAFYRRHGVTDIEPAAESGLDLSGRKVMTTHYCIKHQLGLCPKRGRAPHYPEPFYLVDAEGRRLELRFDCAHCQMEVYLGSKRLEVPRFR